MRSILDIVKKFSGDLRYLLGMSEPFEYEVANGRVFKVSANNRQQVLVFSEVRSWKRNDAKTISVYQDDCSLVIWDESNKLGSILEKELPDCWTMEDDTND